jgi:curved DNA-binding protein CbpA
MYRFAKRKITLPQGVKLGATDPYVVLGVNRQADLKTVKREYYKLAKKYHPDLNPDNERAQ